jgi:phage terminase large subunit
MFKRITAVNKIRALKKRKKVIQGGTSAGKTFSILSILIDKAAKTPLLEISVVSETIPHLRKGAMKDFIKIMKYTGRWIDEHWNRTLLTYTFTNGSYIEFFPATDQRGARRNILYVNECDNLTFEQYHQLAVRTSDEIYLCYNPTAEFWVHTEVLKEPDAELLILTYRDNEAAPDNVRSEFDIALKKAETSNYWANWCRVYIDGEVGVVEGIIYPDWKIIDKIPPEARLLGSGIDFGFTNDPTTVVDLYKWNDEYIFDERLYQTGIGNRELFNAIHNVRALYIADSSEPKSIAELQGYGLIIQGAVKGPDSVRYGISLLQSNTVSITSRSTNGIKELRRYCWDKSKSGDMLKMPIDNFNHFMDAARYVGMRFMATVKRKLRVV